MPYWFQKKTKPSLVKIYSKIGNRLLSNEIFSKNYTKSQVKSWNSTARIQIRPALSERQKITIVLPSLRSKSFSAGPMIGIQLGCSLVQTGFDVRIAAVDGHDEYVIPIGEISKIMEDTIPNFANFVSKISFEVISDTFLISANESFIATAWWTFGLCSEASRISGAHNNLFYLIQDYEALLHPSSVEQVLARETYELKHYSIIASEPLKLFFEKNDIGQVAQNIRTGNYSLLLKTLAKKSY